MSQMSEIITCPAEPNEHIAAELWLGHLARGQTGQLVILSGSMAPLLQPGEKVRVTPHFRPVLPGDLVVFRQRDRLVCHRIMFPYKRWCYLQKGDANQQWEKVVAVDIIGKPDLLLTANTQVPLQGPRFRFYNTWLWMLILTRDLARPLTRRLPRGSYWFERLFSRSTAAIISRVRRTGETEIS